MLGQLRRAWHERSTPSQGTWDAATSELAGLREELNALVNALHRRRENGLSAYDALEDGRVAPDRAEIAFETVYARWWIDRVVSHDPVLRRFLPERHEDAIQRFRAADARVTELSKQVVIVGDPEQLPPTNVGDRGVDDIADGSDVADQESILDECLAANIPRRNLDWHDRSRHESLIAFSNSRYSGGRLVTLPSPVTDDRAVRLTLVPDGVYERGAGRVNRPEARAVVAEIVRRLRDPSFRIDLGVVHPDAPGRYLAGVECDGATYHGSATARDRDRLREHVLTDLGWRIRRVWSPEWWMDAEAALAKLDRRLIEDLEADRARAAAAAPIDVTVGPEMAERWYA